MPSGKLCPAVTLAGFLKACVSKQNHEMAGNTNHRRRKGKKVKSNIVSATHNQTLNQQRQLHDSDHHVLINNTEC
jgi:hypothetical protein